MLSATSDPTDSAIRTAMKMEQTGSVGDKQSELKMAVSQRKGINKDLYDLSRKTQSVSNGFTQPWHLSPSVTLKCYNKMWPELVCGLLSS